jgi:hypothetical protein
MMPFLPAHITSTPAHQLPLTVAALLISAIGAISLGAAYLERRGRLDGTTASVPFQRWSAVAAAGWSLGAAAIHFAVIGEHFELVPAEGIFFMVVAWFQVGWAVTFVSRPLPSIALIGGVVNAAVVAVWAWSRLVGLPIGGHGDGTEPIAVNDAIATAFEVALVITVLVGAAIRGRPFAERLMLPPASAVAWTGSSLAIAVILASVGIVQGSSHDHATTAAGDDHGMLSGEPGTVVFGSQLDGEGGILDPSASLPAGGSVAWAAYFSSASAGRPIELVISTIGDDGEAAEIAREPVFLVRADTLSLTEVRDLGALGSGAGTYEVRYETDGTVLAEGEVELVP